MTNPLTRAVATAACSTIILAVPSVAQTPKVALQVQSKSWIAGSGFDLSGFSDACTAAGLEIVPVVRGADAIVVVQYTESKGPGFSMFGVGTPVGYGTNIAYKLTLLASATAKTLISVTADAETPAGLAKESFHKGALEAFRNNPAYRLSCSVVAAALGARDQAIRLLPWAVLDRRALSLLDKSGFSPASEVERAYIALAKRDFTTLASLGSSGIEPLALLFLNSRSSRDGIGEFSASSPENAKTLIRAVTALASLDDDERIPDAFSTFLNDYAEYQSGEDGVISPVLSAVIQALGKIGTIFTLPLLEEWQNADTPTAKEARRAAEALRKRLTF